MQGSHHIFAAAFGGMVLGSPGTALAQVPPPPVETGSAAEPDAGEIVVTAQRRSESLRDVPISIIAKTGEQLERSGVTGINQISLLTPGVKIDQIGVYLQPAIRGVSSTVSGPGNDAPVAIYVDGVIQPNQNANFIEFVDLARIEVAKGPQGTLFGRNATGGAISIFTQSPSFTPTGRASIGYGNYDNLVAKAYASGPIVPDVLAASISGYFERRDGFDINLLDGRRTRGLRSKVVRGKLLFQPTNWAKFTVSGQYQDRFTSDAASSVALARNTPAVLDPTAIIATRPRTISEDLPTFLDVQSRTASLQAEFTIGDLGALTATTGYGDVDVEVAFDTDRAVTSPTMGFYTGVIYDSPDEYFTQELSFASDRFGVFSFVAGLYYYWQDTEFVNLRVISSRDVNTNFNFNSHSRSEAYAAFTEANVDVTDRLRVIAGIRYSKEKRLNSGGIAFGSAVPVGTPIKGPSLTFDAWTPRVAVQYEVADTTNVYFTYSKGFKSGGSNSTAFLGVPAYQPETIDAYEIGLKSSPVAKLSVNLAGYYYDYKDLQVQVQETIATGFILNAATARIYGFDADMIWRPTSGLSLTAGLSILDAKYGSFPNASVQRPVFVNNVPTGNVSVSTDASGNTLTRAPGFSGSLVADYRRKTNAGTFGGNLSYAYTGTVFYDSDNRIRQRPYGLLNALLSWQPNDSGLRFELYGRNLTDETYIQSALISEADAVGYSPPRTYGVTANYSF